MKNLNVLESIKEIENHAKCISKQDERMIRTHNIGEVVRQGDVYIHMVKADYPVGKELNVRQLADGVSIGQRHILKGHCKVYECTQLPDYMHSDFRNFISYAFDVLEDGATLTHPEHAHISFFSRGRCVVSYQMDAQTRKRVQD